MGLFTMANGLTATALDQHYSCAAQSLPYTTSLSALALGRSAQMNPGAGFLFSSVVFYDALVKLHAYTYLGMSESGSTGSCVSPTRPSVFLAGFISRFNAHGNASLKKRARQIKRIKSPTAESSNKLRKRGWSLQEGITIK